MNSIAEEREFFKHLFDMLESHFGTEIEVVLHDLSKGEASTIIDIRNGSVTNRTHGGVQAHHGLQVVPGITKEDDHYREIVYTEDGKILRGSTMKVRNPEGKIIGSICINQDITQMVEIENYIQKRNGFHLNMHDTPVENITALLDDMIQQALVSVGKHYSAMTKEDKMEFIHYLDERGAFLISKSGPRICQLLNISKFTMYNYLEAVRSSPDKKDPKVFKTEEMP